MLSTSPFLSIQLSFGDHPINQFICCEIDRYSSAVAFKSRHEYDVKQFLRFGIRTQLQKFVLFFSDSPRHSVSDCNSSSEQLRRRTRWWKNYCNVSEQRTVENAFCVTAQQMMRLSPVPVQ
jgi:hypothetical protein